MLGDLREGLKQIRGMMAPSLVGAGKSEHRYETPLFTKVHLLHRLVSVTQQ